MALSYAFSPHLGETPETLARRRQIAEALLASGMRQTPQTIGEGLTALGAGIGGRLQLNRIDRAEAAGRSGADAVFASLFGGAGGGGGTDTLAGGGGGGSGSFRDAIAGIESGGRYDIVGPTHPKLGRALGKYQVMEANVGPWSKEILGRSVSPQEFLSSPEIQDAIFDGKFGQYVQKYGPEGAARAWFGGPGNIKNLGAKDVFGTTVGGYGDRFMQSLGSDALAGGAGEDQLDATGITNIDPNPQPSYETDPAANEAAVRAALLQTEEPIDGTGITNIDPGAMVPNPRPRPDMPMTGGAGTDALAGGAVADRMGVDPLPQTSGLMGPVASAGHDSLAPGGGIGAVAAALGGGGGSPALTGSTGGDAMGAGGSMAAPAGVQTAQGGPSQEQLLQALADPWLSEEQRAVLTLLLKQQMEQADPANQLALEKARLEIDALKNPAPKAPINAGNGWLYHPDSGEWEAAPEPKGKDFRVATPEEAAKYGAAGGQFGPDGRFYPIDPPSGMSIVSDGAGGFTITQGPGAGGKALTEGQSKDTVFATRAEGAMTALDKYDTALTSFMDRLTENDPTGVIRGTQSEEFQLGYQAGKEFLQAILRKDTGAAITKEETAEYGTVYLPQPGDGAALIAQKKQARKRALEAIKAGMPPQAILNQEIALRNSGTPEADSAPVPGPAPTPAPPDAGGGITREEAEAELRRRGLID